MCSVVFVARAHGCCGHCAINMSLCRGSYRPQQCSLVCPKFLNKEEERVCSRERWKLSVPDSMLMEKRISIKVARQVSVILSVISFVGYFPGQCVNIMQAFL